MPTASMGVKFQGCGINLVRDKDKIMTIGNTRLFIFFLNLFIYLLSIKIPFLMKNSNFFLSLSIARLVHNFDQTCFLQKN